MITFYCINTKIHKYNFVFVIEQLTREYGLFSPYKQLKIMDLFEKYNEYLNKRIFSTYTPNPNPNPILKSPPLILLICQLEYKFHLPL
jgi:hypothetical protein